MFGEGGDAAGSLPAVTDVTEDRAADTPNSLWSDSVGDTSAARTGTSCGFAPNNNAPPSDIARRGSDDVADLGRAAVSTLAAVLRGGEDMLTITACARTRSGRLLQGEIPPRKRMRRARVNPSPTPTEARDSKDSSTAPCQGQTCASGSMLVAAKVRARNSTRRVAADAHTTTKYAPPGISMVTLVSPPPGGRVCAPALAREALLAAAQETCGGGVGF